MQFYELISNAYGKYYYMSLKISLTTILNLIVLNTAFLRTFKNEIQSFRKGNVIRERFITLSVLMEFSMLYIIRILNLFVTKFKTYL